MYGGDFIPFEHLIGEALSRCDMSLRTDGVFASAKDQLLAAFERLAAFPDVVPALRVLHERGARLGVASNTSRHLLEVHLAAFDGMIDLSTCADEVHAYKPRQAVFDRIEAWRQAGEPHVHVAKGYWWDIEPARRRGWDAIWINRDALQAYEPMRLHKPLQPDGPLPTVHESLPSRQRSQRFSDDDDGAQKGAAPSTDDQPVRQLPTLQALPELLQTMTTALRAIPFEPVARNSQARGMSGC